MIREDEVVLHKDSFMELEQEKEEDEEEGRLTTFPDEVLENVLKFVTGHKDRNAVSVVCKAWYKAEGWNREAVFIGNCYAVSPDILTRRFPRLKSMTLKGKPRFADFSLVPPNWGAFFHPWMPVIVESYPWLEALRLKRMTVSDESLFMISQLLPNFRALNLVNCDGFSTEGIAAITSHCRYLQELDLQECLVDDRGGEWLSYFPESCNTLVTLNFSCLESDVNFECLEKLVSRCRSLKKLNLNKGVTLEQLLRLLVKAPQLTDLGTGTYSQMQNWSQYVELRTALSNCKDLRHLSGFWMVEPIFIPLIYPLAQNLLSLNLSYATIRATEFAKLIQRCPKLETLWVLDSVEDRGLQTVGETCKNLVELRVFPTDHGGQGSVTEAGLVAVSQGCPNLSSVLYFCKQCTNQAIETVATNCPMLTRFRLCIITPRQRDYITGETMDEGFGAIVKNCKNLSRLAVSGWLSDRAFEYIGHYAKKLETLSVAFAGESDAAMQHVLSGCPRLRKLEIRDSPFGDSALLAGLHQYESMRFLWMSACRVSLAGCGWLAGAMPRLNVEVIREQGDAEGGEGGEKGGGELVMDCSEPVEKLYAYRTLAGCRSDAPSWVITL
ncbi:protein AUXIN SIGNALING F-BOX 3 [Selaginella moellendorffii]|nr:protein AUXIN SIGNALING F-BOX 3 [Selaginella moellendorffii]XP_024542170.1 protein AUXIN SIGNALING F-BOX 3 [Selaginella moellendorffii]XP_024542171.1 protein AUXIN SIGNALING F-BOX 3 [Selaginella moellendorffii]XP_024542172.1 protein AUXIN SIGNALING F-BOX 3 [Selaginella moellendorffii]|eukprot:XP_002981422.2 protein AUXIN SIGNALING F-BOX 3 [Selaginella moellendorffii]